MMNDQIIFAEQSILGAILMDESAYSEVCDIITADDFYMDVDKEIYKACSSISLNGELIDLAVLSNMLAGKVSIDYLKQLLLITSGAANVVEWAKQVKNASKIRQLKEIGKMLYEDINEADDPTKTIGEVQQSLERIESDDTKRDLADSTEMMNRFMDHRRKIDAGNDEFVKTGVAALDEILGGGMLNSGLYVLAARPGCGKTTLALQIADYVIKKGPALFVSLEMDLEQIAAKRISRVSGISSNKLLMGGLTDEEKMKVGPIATELSIQPLFVNKSPSATVDDITFLARKIKGIKMIIIDYFGIIQPVVSNKSRYEDMTIISGRLKALARKMKVPILCLAQLNRENQQRKDKRPMLSDLRDTGAIEQDADGVIFIHKQDSYDDEQNNKYEPEDIEIIVAKNRHAGTGKFDASFYKRVSKIVPNYQR